MPAPLANLSPQQLALYAASGIIGAIVVKAVDFVSSLSPTRQTREQRIDAKWQAFVEEQGKAREADQAEITELRRAYDEQRQLCERLLKRLDEVTAQLDEMKAQGDAKDALIRDQRETIDRLRKEKDQTAASHARVIKDKDTTIKTLQSAKAEAQAQAADMEKRLRAEIDRLQGEIDQLKAQIASPAIVPVPAV
jgi:chromosome segregation ATPase